ncbi:MAG: RNA polymerase sigma factor [Acidimicrobiia bacterium]
MAQEPDGWERELIERMLVGDERALAMAFDQYAPVVYGVAARLIGADAAADVCQEVFLALWDHPDRYDPQRSTLRSFLIMIARRRCIDHLRRHGRREATEQAAGRRVDGPTPPNVDEAALAMIAGQRVRAALDDLPVEQRRAVELAYFGGLTFREVAVATGVSEGTAKSRIRLGLRRLGAALGQHERLEAP